MLQEAYLEAYRSEPTFANEARRDLSDKDRAVLPLVGAAARVLRVPRGTAASRVTFARDRLRRSMADA